jgi:hypothetical protein
MKFLFGFLVWENKNNFKDIVASCLFSSKGHVVSSQVHVDDIKSYFLVMIQGFDIWGFRRKYNE